MNTLVQYLELGMLVLGLILVGGAGVTAFLVWLLAKGVSEDLFGADF